MTSHALSHYELLVLLATAHVGEGAYGVAIAKAIEDASGRETTVASVYRALQRLEERGLVRTRLGEATPERGGRAKRLVEITTAGKRQAVHTQRTLQRLGFAYEA